MGAQLWLLRSARHCIPQVQPDFLYFCFAFLRTSLSFRFILTCRGRETDKYFLKSYLPYGIYYTIGKLNDSKSLIVAIFQAFYHGYETSLEAFRIIQLFQQQQLMNELRPEVRNALNDRGRVNFILGRKLLTRGIELGLIKKINVFEMADVIWGSIVGVIQLEDIKSDDQKNHKLKQNTLRLAQRLIVDALTDSGKPEKAKNKKREK